MERSFSQHDYEVALGEVRKWMLARDEEPPHVEHVAHLAVQLFDGLVKLHQLSWKHRWMLHAAALLHDVGWAGAPDGRKHHKVGAQMIRSHPWKHFPQDWAKQVACIARYHRRATPRPNHRHYNKFSSNDRKAMARLAALLRIADGLDRPHLGRVKSVTARVGVRVVVLKLKGKKDLNVEISGALRKADLFELAYRRGLKIRQ